MSSNWYVKLLDKVYDIGYNVYIVDKETQMTTKQAIRNAKVIMVKTSIGISVKISKRQARGLLDYCNENNHELPVDITEIYDGKVLLILG